MLETCLLTLVTAANSLYTTFYYVLYWSYMTGHLLVNCLNETLQYLIFTWESVACFFTILSESLGMFLHDNIQLVKLIFFQLGSALEIVGSSCLGIFMKCNAFLRAIFNTISWIFYCLWGGITVTINGVIGVVTIIKKLIIIFGSGIWFLITLLPLLLYYGYVMLTTFISTITSELCDMSATGVSKIIILIKSMLLFVIDVPFESLIGLIVGLSFAYIFTQFYMILSTFMKRKYRLVRNWYRRQHNNIYGSFQSTRTGQRQALPLPKARRTLREIQQSSCATKNNEDEDSVERNCVICQERMKCILLLPCKHLCLCPQCSEELRYYNQSCPICRTDIDATMKIFI